MNTLKANQQTAAVAATAIAAFAVSLLVARSKRRATEDKKETPAQVGNEAEKKLTGTELDLKKAVDDSDTASTRSSVSKYSAKDQRSVQSRSSNEAASSATTSPIALPSKLKNDMAPSTAKPAPRVAYLPKVKAVTAHSRKPLSPLIKEPRLAKNTKQPPVTKARPVVTSRPISKPISVMKQSKATKKAKKAIRVRDSLLPASIRKNLVKDDEQESETPTLANILPPSPPPNTTKKAKKAIRVRDSLLPASIRKNLVKKEPEDQENETPTLANLLPPSPPTRTSNRRDAIKPMRGAHVRDSLMPASLRKKKATDEAAGFVSPRQATRLPQKLTPTRKNIFEAPLVGQY